MCACVLPSCWCNRAKWQCSHRLSWFWYEWRLLDMIQIHPQQGRSPPDMVCWTFFWLAVKTCVPHFYFIELSEDSIRTRGNKYKLAQHWACSEIRSRVLRSASKCYCAVLLWIKERHSSTSKHFEALRSIFQNTPTTVITT